MFDLVRRKRRARRPLLRRVVRLRGGSAESIERPFFVYEIAGKCHAITGQEPRRNEIIRNESADGAASAEVISPEGKRAFESRGRMYLNLDRTLYVTRRGHPPGFLRTKCREGVSLSSTARLPPRVTAESPSEKRPRTRFVRLAILSRFHLADGFVTFISAFTRAKTPRRRGSFLPLRDKVTSKRRRRPLSRERLDDPRGIHSMYTSLDPNHRPGIRSVYSIERRDREVKSYTRGVENLSPMKRPRKKFGWLCDEGVPVGGGAEVSHRGQRQLFSW